MKRILTLLVLVAVAHVSTVAALPANFYQNINIHFAVVEPGHSTGNGATVSNLTLTTPMIVKIIGEATTNNFSAKAKLMEYLPITYYTNNVLTTNHTKVVTNSYVYGYLGNPTFIVQDGATRVDISSLIQVTTVNSNYIESYLNGKQGGYAAFQNYRIRSLTFSSALQTLNGQGFVTTPLKNITVAPGVIVEGDSDLWSSFSGVASGEFVNGVVQGTIAATYDHVQ
jgi:hypothetical protein